MGEVIAWLNQNGTAVQALATVVLVIVTATYAVFAWRQAEAMELSSDAARKAAEANERMAQLRARRESAQRLDTLRDAETELRSLSVLAETLANHPEAGIRIGSDDQYALKVDPGAIHRIRKASRRVGSNLGDVLGRAAEAAYELRVKITEYRASEIRHKGSPPERFQDAVVSAATTAEDVLDDAVTALRSAIRQHGEDDVGSSDE